MEIEFKQVSKKKIIIYGIQLGQKKEIGHIFTPAGSSEDVKNAIQVCGADNAYDLWGCAIYGERLPDVIKETPINYPERVKEILKRDDVKKIFDEPTIEALKRGVNISKEKQFKAKKDIQLRFSMYDNYSGVIEHEHNLLSDCNRCYSKPCYCGKQPLQMQSEFDPTFASKLERGEFRFIPNERNSLIMQRFSNSSHAMRVEDGTSNEKDGTTMIYTAKAKEFKEMISIIHSLAFAKEELEEMIINSEDDMTLKIKINFGIGPMKIVSVEKVIV